MRTTSSRVRWIRYLGLASLCAGIAGAGLETVLIPSSECRVRQNAEGLGLWWAPDSAWAMRLTAVEGLERVEAVMKSDPGTYESWLMMQKMVSERADWFWIRVRLVKVKSVTFTKSSKIVITTKHGERIESDEVYFWPDRQQTGLYESKRSPVVVSRTSVWQGNDGLAPTGVVKFRLGSVRVSDIVSFKAVGTAEQNEDGGQ